MMEGGAPETTTSRPRPSGAHPQDVALGRKNVAPLRDQLLVGVPDRTYLAIEIVQPERVHAAVVLAEPGVPIDLILQAVPREADDRHAVLLQAMHVGPLLLQPVDRLFAAEAVGLGVHDRQVDNARSTGA